MPAIYSKPHLSLTQQLALLKKRSLHVNDDAAALECLHRNGYYRLSAYLYPFRDLQTDNFLPNSHFEDAQALYVFDKKIKLLLLDAIERVEIATRAEIALHLGARDIFAHTKSQFFRSSFTRTNSSGQSKYQTWHNNFNKAVDRSKDEFVLHYERKYGARSPLPIWIAIELWDFGLLSHFYSGMTTPDCVAVANRFAIPRWHLLESWLRCLNYVRNVIAHHGRLWNLNLADNPKLPQHGLMPDFDALLSLHNANTRLYSICCILVHFSKAVNPQSSWPRDLANHIISFPSIPLVNIQSMGFPVDWQSHAFWK